MSKEGQTQFNSKKKILLMGGPNVGKSVFFTHLTGIYAVSSNYIGTTVSYMEGDLTLPNGEVFDLIDVPGTFSMSATSEAEEVAVKFMEERPEAILFVLDASNLEGSLRLAVEVQDYGIPMIYALNMMDVAEKKGIEVQTQVLADRLKAPIIETIAISQFGFDKIPAALADAVRKDHHKPKEKKDNEYYWGEAEAIALQSTADIEGHPDWLDRLGDAMIKPWPGIPIAVFVLLVSIGLVVGGGKALRAILLLPLVNGAIVPAFRVLFEAVMSPGVLRDVMIGEYGIFVISFEWIIALILPYVFLFYVLFSFLEDSGYLPRLAVLADNIMSRIGVQGGSLINVFLAFGCAVPAIIGTRTATSYKERLVTTIMICFAVPCISQIGALVALTANYSYWMLLALAIFGLIALIISGLVASRFVAGQVSPMIIKLPNLLMPNRKSYFAKLKSQMHSFVIEAEGPMLLAIVIAAVIKETGALDKIALFFEPLVAGWLNLPPEAAIILILGIIRREMAVAPLLGMNLDPLQMFTGAVVALLYIPCLSVFGIVVKEFNLRIGLGIVIGTTVTAIFVGGLFAQIAGIFL